MRKYYLISFLCLCCYFVIGQEITHMRSNIVKLHPFEYAKAEFKLSYERYFNNFKNSIVLTPGIILKDLEDDKRQGLQLNGQFRFYLTNFNEATDNQLLNLYNIELYAGIYGQYLYYDDEYTINWWDNETGTNRSIDQERHINSTEGGAIMGAQVYISKRILFDIFLGGGIRFSNETTEYELPENVYNEDRGGIFPYGYTGVKPTVGFMIGICF